MPSRSSSAKRRLRRSTGPRAETASADTPYGHRLLAVDPHQEAAEGAALDLDRLAARRHPEIGRYAFGKQPLRAIFERNEINPGLARSDRCDARMDFLQLAGRALEALRAFGTDILGAEALRPPALDRRGAALRANLAWNRAANRAARAADIVVEASEAR